MLWAAREIVVSVHIILAIMWVGGILFVGWGVFPAVRAINFLHQQTFLLALMKWTHRLFSLAGGGVVLTGILLGTIFGPIRNVETIVSTAYGNKFILAFSIGVITLFWGMLVSYRHSMNVLEKSVLWELAEEGDEEFLINALRGVMIVSGVEVVGFFSLLAIMISF